MVHDPCASLSGSRRVIFILPAAWPSQRPAYNASITKAEGCWRACPHFSSERGCVVHDQPQPHRNSDLLRLVSDTAALRRAVGFSSLC